MDGLPNANGVYQVPISSKKLIKCEGFPSNIHDRQYDGCYFPYRGEDWDEFIPFRNAGDVAQLRDHSGKYVHAISWWKGYPISYSEPSIEFANTSLRNKSIQFIGEHPNEKSDYSVQVQGTPGIPNNSVNAEIIENLQNGILFNELELKVEIIQHASDGMDNGIVEVSHIGPQQIAEFNLDGFLDGTNLGIQQLNFPFIIENLAVGTHNIIVTDYYDECFSIESDFTIISEKTIEIEICEGDCVTLNSDNVDPDLIASSPCIKWIDENGNVISSGTEVEVCGEDSQTITQYIENADGLIGATITHIVNIVDMSFTVDEVIPDECPPSQIEITIEGENISEILWSNGSTGSSLIVEASGDYNVTLTSPTGCVIETSIFIYEDTFINDSDGDGVCDFEDCSPFNSLIFYEGTCDDIDDCTKDDKYDKDCNCIGVPIANCETCQVGSPCDDNNYCTENDVIDEECNCIGELIDDCFNDCEVGAPCDDNNECTSNDQIDSNCGCVGVAVENCSECVSGSPCDDGNNCTAIDIYNSDCQCQGELQGEVDLQLQQDGYCESNSYTLIASSNFDSYEWFWEGQALNFSENQIDVFKSGNYKVAVSNGEGCFYTNEIFVSDTYTSKDLVISATKETICTKLETIVLSIPDGFSQISWFDNFDNSIGSHSNTVTIDAAGKYYVTAMDDFGCPKKGEISIESDIKNYKIEPKYPTICKVGDEIKLSVSDDIGNFYKWSVEGETTHSITVFAPGTYSVTVTSNEGCVAVDQVDVLLEDDVDIDKVLLENGFRKERILITGIETIKDDDGGSTRDLVCEINASQSKKYQIKRVEADPQGDIIDLEKFITAEVNRFQCFEQDATGILVDNFCSEDEDGVTLSEFVDQEEVNSFKYFILETGVDMESFLYFRSPTFVECSVGGDDNDSFKSLLYDIMCKKSKGLDLVLEYDTRKVKYNSTIADAHFMSSGTIQLPAIEVDKIEYSSYLYANYDNFVKLHGLLISNYQKGGKLLTSNPLNFPKGEVVDKAILTYHGFSHSDTVNNDFYEIKIPYDPNTIEIELDPDNVIECEEGLCESLDDQYYLSLYIPLDKYDSDLVAQSNNDKFNGFFNNTSTLVNAILNGADRPFTLRDLPLCMFDQDDVCQLFNVNYRLQEDALDLVNSKLTNADFTYSSAIIDCFDDFNLVNEYGKLDNSWLKREDTKLYRLLSNHYFNLQNPIDLQISQPEKTTFLYETEISIFDIEKNKNYFIKPGYEQFLLKKGIAPLEYINYFDSDKSTQTKEGILLHPAKQYDYLNQVSSWPKKDGKLSNVKVPGIYVAYVVNASNDKTFDKIVNNVADIAGLFFGYTELKVIHKTKRWATANAMLAAADIPLTMTSLFLTNSDDYCYDGETDICKNLRAFHRTAQILLLSGNITNAMIPDLKKAQVNFENLGDDQDKILNKLDEIDTGSPKSLREDFLILMNLNIDLLTKLKTTFDKILTTFPNDKIFTDLIAAIDEKDIYKLFELKNAIKNLDINNAEAVNGIEFFQDLIATAKIDGKIGKGLGELTEESVKAWETLRNLPEDIRNDVSLLTRLEEDFLDHSEFKLFLDADANRPKKWSVLNKINSSNHSITDVNLSEWFEDLWLVDDLEIDLINPQKTMIKYGGDGIANIDGNGVNISSYDDTGDEYVLAFVTKDENFAIAKSMDGIKAGCKGGACFVEGTLVNTPDRGLIPIEKIRKGQNVFAYDHKINEVVESKVINTFERMWSTILEIEINGDVVMTTEEHPFYIPSMKEYLPADDLIIGTDLLAMNGENSIVTNIVKRDTLIMVYNLEIAQHHNYFVSNESILVHNITNGYFKNAIKDQFESLPSIQESSVTPQPYSPPLDFKMDDNGFDIYNNTYDFVVKENGDLLIGNGHYNLTNEASSVKFAGQISFDANGKIWNINNNSGHYNSDKEKLLGAFGALGKSIGHTFNDVVDLQDIATSWTGQWIR